MYTFSMPDDIPATKKQCMSCTQSKRPNSIYSWWVKNPLKKIDYPVMSSYCRKLEVGGTLMSPNTTDFNTLGSS
jgi:hypothetical protein